MPSPAESYLDHVDTALRRVRTQMTAIGTAADWCAETILAGRMVHLFGSGHSRILVEEMWPRYGSFPGFNPIVELSLTFHNLVVGANGQRQAMFLENVSGLASRILRNFALSPQDTAIVISSSGTNTVPVEMAEAFQAAGIKVIALVSLEHSENSASKRPDGKKLTDFADLILDTGAPAGDACVEIQGVAGKVAPLSTVGGCAIINALKAEIAQRLSDAGQPPLALVAANQVGPEKAAEIFEAAYDEHARRMAKLFQGGANR
ncbi:MAG: SIS domain-containing protein [Verrucomicrobiae bacterium]|nr:SIS domain-containing protein [Verrucomicrobiae bacterium]